MLNNYEDAFLWYQENAHRIDRFEFVEEDGTRRPLTNTEMYWLTNIKQAEDDGVDVSTDPQAQLEQALRDNARLRGLLREAGRLLWEHHECRVSGLPPGTVCYICEKSMIFYRIEAAMKGKP